MVSDELKGRVELANKLIAKNGDTEEYADALYQYGEYIIVKEDDLEYGKKALADAKACTERIIAKGTGADVWALDKYCKENNVQFSILNLYFKILLVEARYRNLDSYLLYLEKNREPKDRFYLPKRKCFMRIGLVQALQEMVDDKLDRLSISLPPGTGKTTVEKFMLTGIMGWFPTDYNLFWSHSSGITRMFYDGVYDILTSDEYTWHEIFTECKITSTNAKLEQININKYKPFPNLQTTSNDSSNAGKIRANRLLMVDDMIPGIEVALNKNRLDKLWDTYTVDAKQRKVPGCREIHIATRWSVHDVIGRLQQVYDGQDRQKFIAVPDIDPETGKSNFMYDYNGFDEAFFHDQELTMDDVSYRCLYKNEPIEREGILYHEDDLRYFYELPLREPDAILGVCDTKNKGTDFMALPVLYQYDDDYYFADCIFDDTADFDLQYKQLTDFIVEHNLQQCEFESNNGGERVAFEVEQRLRELKHRCNITTKPTETNKETKIIVNSDWIKKHIIFKAKETITPKSHYDRFMKQFLTYSVAGKNAHDDAPDVMANFSLYVANKERIRPSMIMRGVL